MVLDNTKGDLFLVQDGSTKPLGEVCGTSQNSLTKETVSHIYDLPHEFFSGCVVQLWWGTDAADAPCSEVTSSGYGRGVYHPLTSICVRRASVQLVQRRFWVHIGGGETFLICHGWGLVAVD